jgi:hypothetical protein
MSFYQVPGLFAIWRAIDAVGDHPSQHRHRSSIQFKIYRAVFPTLPHPHTHLVNDNFEFESAMWN